MGSSSADAEEVLVFANRCQVGVGAWIAADDLPAMLAAVWTSLQDVPKDGQRSAALVARMVLGFAERLGKENGSPAAGLAIRSGSRVKVIQALARVLAGSGDASLSLNSVAAHVGISGCHLSRIVSSETAHTFETHLHGIRVLKATVLLRDTLLSMEEVSTKVGYRSVTNFDRHVQRWLHMSPTFFRRASARRF